MGKEHNVRGAAGVLTFVVVVSSHLIVMYSYCYLLTEDKDMESICLFFFMVLR